MSEMVHYIITNEIVLMKQYANDRGPEAETCLPFGHSMEAANLPAF